MVFSSLIFLFAFLPIVLLVYHLVPASLKNLVLLLASIFFYAWGEPVYIVLMLFSTVFNYVIGIDMGNNKGKEKELKNDLILALVVNLFILAYFKYTGFFLSIIRIKYANLALPIGISFYTFQTLSYIIDVYRGKIEAQKNYLNFALYICMFPQLIAGPIVKYVDIESQLNKRRNTISNFGLGVEVFIKGLSKKVLLANNVGLIASSIQGIHASERSVVTAWIGAIAYTFQIYFDFSGYSDMAIGLGKMFGFEFPRNFDYPYTSTSITDFWRRWHISLGAWFRDYIYIPMGGNRVPLKRHIINIMSVWLLTGLWHGASWNFVFWGIYYGIILLLEKYVWGEYLLRIPVFIQRIYALFFVIIGWVLFMSESLGSAFTYLKCMFGFGHGFLDTTAGYYLSISFLLLVLCALFSVHYPNRLFRKIIAKTPEIAVVVNACLVLLSVAYLVFDTYNPFLYFRF